MKIFNNKLSAALALTTSLFAATASALTLPEIGSFESIDDYEDAYTLATKVAGGGGGSAFNDMSTIKNENPWIKPNRVEIRDGQRIDKITLAYGYSEGTDEFTVSHGGGGGSLGDIIYIADNEYIKSVKVCSTDSTLTKGRVGQLVIKIKNESEITQIKTYGKTCNSSKDFIAQTGYHIIGFKGRSGSEVDQLQAIYAPRLKIDSTVTIGTPVYQTAELHDSSSGRNLNDTSSSRTTGFNYSLVEGYSATTNWSNTATFNLGFTISQAVELGMYGPASGSVTSTLTLSSSFTDSFQWGKSNVENTTSTVGVTHEVNADAYKAVIAKVDIMKIEAVAPLTIEYTNVYTGDVYTAEGSISQYANWQINSYAVEFGDFVNGKIVVKPQYLSSGLYSCYDNKTAQEAQSCPVQ